MPGSKNGHVENTLARAPKPVKCSSGLDTSILFSSSEKALRFVIHLARPLRRAVSDWYVPDVGEAQRRRQGRDRGGDILNHRLTLV